MIVNRPFSCALALCLSLFACNDGDDDLAKSSDSATSQQPLFLVHSAVSGLGNSRTNYFTPVADLAAPTKLDYRLAIEMSGRPRLYTAPKLGIFAIANSEDLSITKYELAGDASLRPSDSKVSLLNTGIKTLEPQGIHFVSATKAYYKDSGQARVLVIDPTRMTIEKTLDLPRELLVPGRTVSFSRWAARDGEAYFAVGATTDDYTRTLPGTTLVRIDTENDAITLVRDERCRGLSYTASVAGALYFFSDVINGLGHAVYPNDAGQQDCTLRILPKQRTFDPSYVGSVAPALGGQIGTIVAATEAGEAWVQVIDPAVMPTAPGTTYQAWYRAGWRWVHLPLATLTNPVEVGLAPGAFTAQTVTVGSAFYVSQASAQYGTTTLVDLSSGTPKPGVSFDGFPLDVARIR